MKTYFSNHFYRLAGFLAGLIIGLIGIVINIPNLIGIIITKLNSLVFESLTPVQSSARLAIAAFVILMAVGFLTNLPFLWIVAITLIIWTTTYLFLFFLTTFGQ